jgi:hypothetical protein
MYSGLYLYLPLNQLFKQHQSIISKTVALPLVQAAGGRKMCSVSSLETATPPAQRPCCHTLRNGLRSLSIQRCAKSGWVLRQRASSVCMGSGARSRIGSEAQKQLRSTSVSSSICCCCASIHTTASLDLRLLGRLDLHWVCSMCHAVSSRSPAAIDLIQGRMLAEQQT